MSLYYRNRRDITSIEGIEVDAGSLWVLTTDRKTLLLDDEDQYATMLLSEDFEECL